MGRTRTCNDDSRQNTPEPPRGYQEILGFDQNVHCKSLFELHFNVQGTVDVSFTGSVLYSRT